MDKPPATKKIQLGDGSMVDQPVCASCRYCEQPIGGKHVCRYFPPVPSSTTRDMAAHVKPEHDWCSSHQPINA